MQDSASHIATPKVSRRTIMQLAGISATAGLLAAGSSGTAQAEGRALATEPDTSSPQRKWAAQNLRGLANLFLPSFLPDMKTLDEAALRHDVRAAKAQGFCGTMPMINWTLPGDPQWELFYQTVIDEADGKLPVHGMTFTSHVDTDIKLMKAQERLGVDAFLIASKHAPDISADDLYDAMRRRIEATDLPVLLYAALNEGRAFPHLGPAGQPLDVYDRLADLPNVVALKISQPVTLTTTMQLCDTVADRLLVAPVNLDFVPMLARHYHMQWSGQWNGEAVQTPDVQLGNQLLAATAAGDLETADKVARQIQPAHSHFYTLQSEIIRGGAHPWQHNKYYGWLGGGNGGLMPMDEHAPEGSVPALTAADRAAMRAAFTASGLTPTDAPEEQFIVGRAAWNRGARPADMRTIPSYET